MRYIFADCELDTELYTLQRQGRLLHVRPKVLQQPELVAHHYTAGGEKSLAVSYWQRAGQQAMRCAARVEAVQHYHRDLAVLRMLPASPQCTDQDLTFHMLLNTTARRRPRFLSI